MKFSLSAIDAALAVSLATIYSLIEIELEGKCGWAATIPTSQVAKGNHFTWYHLYMIVFLSIMCIGIWWKRYEVPWWKKILIAAFFLTWILLLEDFLWFVFSPYFTLKKYKKQNIPWHTKWLGPIPVHNFVGLTILILLALLIGIPEIWGSFVFIIPATILLVCISPLYHLFYKKTHDFNPSKKCPKIPGL